MFVQEGSFGAIAMPWLSACGCRWWASLGASAGAAVILPLARRGRSSLISIALPCHSPLHLRFMMAHLTDTDAHTREEGIPRFFGPMMYQWFAKAFT